MEYLIGVGLAVAVCVFAMLAGMDRDGVFYSTMVIVVAHYYVLFAVMANSMSALRLECMMAAVFLVAAVVGFKRSQWLIVGGLIGHGVFDFFHHLFIQNPGVPAWWPGFCLSFDILAGGFLALLMLRRSRIGSAV